MSVLSRLEKLENHIHTSEEEANLSALSEYTIQARIAMLESAGSDREGYLGDVLPDCPENIQEITVDNLSSAVCRDSFYHFVQAFWHVVSLEEPIWNWHIEFLCKEIQQIVERIFRHEPADYDLVINISPGMSKSTVVSVMLPVWAWTRMPSFRSICGSYTHALALDLSRKSRDVFQSDQYRRWYPHLEIRDDQNTKAYFANNHGGMRYAVGVCGSVLGMHAHLLLPDDPIDPLQVLSEADLKTVHYWMDQVLPSRKVDKEVAAMIMVMQRLHEDDPTGHLLERQRTRVRHICLPAEVTDEIYPEEVRERYVNGLMDPVRMSRNTLDRERQKLGEWAYAAQYLQRPQPMGGGLFKEIYFNARVQAAPYAAARIRYWDLAASESDAACQTAGILLARDDKGNWYLENVVTGRWEPRERNEHIKATALRDRSRYAPNQDPDIVIEHEGGSSGVDAYKYLAGELAGFRVHYDRPRKEKSVRAQPLASQCAAGNVYLVEDGTWDIEGAVRQFCAFPNAKLKDVVDATSGAFNWLLSRPQAGTLFTLTPAKKHGLRLVVCTIDQLATTLIEEPTLLIATNDPPTTPGILAKPTHALARLTDWLPLAFLDLDPAELKERWVKPYPPYADLPEKLILTRDMGKRFWGFVTKRREPPVTTLVFAGDGRALTLALNVARNFNVPTKEINMIGSVNHAPSEPPCKRLFELVRSYRGTVA